ncbi:MAG: hypothetical protein ACM3UU_07545 [Ignavibacteriales bacterium]
MQANAEMKVQSIVLLQRIEEAYSKGYEVFLFNFRVDYPPCHDPKIQQISISELEFIANLNKRFSKRIKHFAQRIFPFLEKARLEGILIVADESELPDKNALSKVFKIITADYQEIAGTILLLNKRKENMQGRPGHRGKKQTISDMEELLVSELYDRADSCIKKGGKVLINGKKADYPICKRKNIEFMDARRIKEVMNEGSAGLRLRETLARYIIKKLNKISVKGPTGDRVREFLAEIMYLISSPAWDYVPPIVIFEPEKIVGMEAIRCRRFYYYKAEKKILYSVLESL